MAGKDEGKLGATLSRSVPLGAGSVGDAAEQLFGRGSRCADRGHRLPTLPLMSNPLPSALEPHGPAPAWAADQSRSLRHRPSGTALSAGGGIVGSDEQWHNKLSVEQTLVGPLKVTTSVEDAGTADSKKSITAGFKRVW